MDLGEIDWLGLITAMGVALLIIAVGWMFVTHIGNGDDGSWAGDTAKRLDENGGSVYTSDGSSVVIYAHLKPTTHVEYRNDAFYITDPNNGHTGLVIIPIDKVTRVYTGAGA